MSDCLVIHSTPFTTEEGEEETDSTSSEADGGECAGWNGETDTIIRRTIPSHTKDYTQRIYSASSDSEE